MTRHLAAPLLFALSCVCPVGGETPAVTEARQEELKMKVDCPASFPDNRNVLLKFAIINATSSRYKLVHRDGIVELDMTGPDGKKITGYHEMEGNTIDLKPVNWFVSSELEPGGEVNGDPVQVSVYWPLEQAGEYRCVMSKIIERETPDAPDGRKPPGPGPNVKVVSPEFRFRINKIDADFHSPLAALVPGWEKPPERRANPIHPGEGLKKGIDRVDPRLIGAGAILCGFLGLFLWRRGKGRAAL